MLVGVGHELLQDRVEASLARPLPRCDGRVDVTGDERLLAEAEREVLPLERLQQERRTQARGAYRIGFVQRDAAEIRGDREA